MNSDEDAIWEGDYKIPWHDPAFSRRMLREHLSQENDLASRRTEWIDRQVKWIHEHVLNAQPSRILDLGCGPGFYTHRLASLGHRCVGIDFGPASIAYAKEHITDHTKCRFVLGDLRHADFGRPFDLAMLLYGELNVFSPADATTILRKAGASLAPRGRLILEIQTPEAVEGIGRAETTEQTCESSVFSDRRHRCRTEGRWLADKRVAIQRFTVTDMADGGVRVFRSTNQSWPDDSLARLLEGVGFRDVRRRNDWPCNSDALALWRAYGTQGP